MIFLIKQKQRNSNSEPKRRWAIWVSVFLIVGTCQFTSQNLISTCYLKIFSSSDVVSWVFIWMIQQRFFTKCGFYFFICRFRIDIQNLKWVKNFDFTDFTISDHCYRIIYCVPENDNNYQLYEWEVPHFLPKSQFRWFYLRLAY